MAFTKIAEIKGDNHQYELSPNVKKYSLMDLGFSTKPNGTFTLERSLDPTSPYNQGIKFKMMVKPDFSGFKMNTTSANGMQSVNIFKREEDEPLVEQYQFLINQLVEREVIIQK